MGKKSVRENKNIYQTSRELAGFTRSAASEALVYISESRLEKIEYETAAPHPEEVISMAECYKNPSLCNYYCSHECPIGQQYVPEVKIKSLSQITLEILANLNDLEAAKARLVEITVDGKISENEMQDFLRIQDTLSKLSLTADTLKLWVDQAVCSGKSNLELENQA